MIKMGEEGIWSQEQIMIGFRINTADYTISLPGEKIEGARLTALSDIYIPGSMQVKVKDIQVLRGLAQHWLVSCFFWKTLMQVLDSLLKHHDERSEWVNCPDYELRRGY